MGDKRDTLLVIVASKKILLLFIYFFFFQICGEKCVGILIEFERNNNGSVI